MWDNSVKARLLDGEVQVGTWIHTLAAPELPHVLAAAGFHHVNIDMEHSRFSIAEVATLCAQALLAGIAPIVRPPAKDAHLISRLVDNGALGIYAPHVDTVDDARQVVDAVKFPPLGHRGSQPPSITTRYRSFDAGDYMPAANQQTMVIVQLESRVAMGNMAEILAVDGVDGAVIGRGDLASDLGIGGRRQAPEITAQVENLIDTCDRLGKIPGLMVLDVEDGLRWKRRGIRMLTYASEMLILRNAAAAAYRQLSDPAEA